MYASRALIKMGAVTAENHINRMKNPHLILLGCQEVDRKRINSSLGLHVKPSS